MPTRLNYINENYEILDQMLNMLAENGVPPESIVLGLKPPKLEFRILCLEDSVISIISPSSEGSPRPV